MTSDAELLLHKHQYILSFLKTFQDLIHIKLSHILTKNSKNMYAQCYHNIHICRRLIQNNHRFHPKTLKMQEYPHYL